MNLFKKYYALVESTAESRYYRFKGLEFKQPSIYEQLEKYKDDPNIYISFTVLKKLGINPKTDFSTPIGFYSYPLSLIWKNFDHLNKKIKVPWAVHMPYIHIFKPKNDANGLFIDKYDESDLKKDIQKIRDSNLFDEEKIDFVLTQTDKARIKTPSGILWFITGILTKSKKNLNEFKKLFVQYIPGSPILWTKILKNVLGYDYVTDSGKGVIHYNEPTQAVFFSTSSIKIIDVIYNRPSINVINKHWIYDKKHKISKDVKFEISVKGDRLYDDMTDDQLGFDWYSGDWHDGVWKAGIWHNGTWWKGTWLQGLFKKGIWKNGTWERGAFGAIEGKVTDAIWEKGTWEDGNFNNGIWEDGTWKDGTWLGGYDIFGNYHLKGDSPDKWEIDDHRDGFISKAKVSDDAIYDYIGAHAIWTDGD